MRYAPITDPAVATAAYSYHGLRWLAARIAVKMSGPPNVGSGELSTMAREKSPNAPKWWNIEVTPWPQRGVASWRKMFNTNSLYQLRWTAFGEQPFLLSQLCPPILRAIVSGRKCLQTSRRSGFCRRAVAKGSEISKMGRIDFRHQG